MANGNAIYNIPSNLSELPAPSQTIGLKYLQVQPRANSVDNSFPNSSINFFWTCSGNQRWVPKRSYLRLRNRMYMNLGDLAKQPQEEKGESPLMAPTYLQAAALFDGAQVRVGGYTVSNVQQHHGQIAACEDRISKSGAFFDTMPPSINYGHVDFEARQAQISIDGVEDLSYGPSFGAGGSQIILVEGITAVPLACSVTAGGLVTENNGTGAFATQGAGQLFPGDSLYIVSAAGGNPRSFMTVVNVVDDNNVQCTPTTAILIGDAGPMFQFLPGINTKPTERANDSETVFQPSLSLFKSDKALQGSWELILNPKSSSQFRTSAMQSNDPALNDGAGLRMRNTSTTNGENMAGFDGSYDCGDIQFFVAIVESASPNPTKESIALALEETNVQPRRITGGQTVESYNVERSVFATSWGLQSSHAGRNTLYPCTEFVAGATHTDSPPTILNPTFNKDQDSLSQYLVTYAGQSRENPAIDVQITPGDGAAVDGVDHTTWQYLISQIANGGHKERGGVVTKAQNRQLGNLNTVLWRRPAGNVSTDMQLNVTYGQGAFPGVDVRHNLLLFSHYRSIVQMDFVDGLCVGFSKQSA